MDHITLPSYRRSGPQQAYRTVVPTAALHAPNQPTPLVSMVLGLHRALLAFVRSVIANHTRP